MSIIYMATNTVNGMRYIGQTNRTLAQRRREHENHGNKDNMPICRAIRKYGRAAFKWEVLSSGILLQEELNAKEHELIRKYKTQVPHGYNLKCGGDSVGSLHAESRRKVSEGMKKHYDAIRAQGLSVTKPHILARRVAVVCVETGVEYVGVREAGRIMDIESAHISLCCNNPTSTTHGYHFRYADDERNNEAQRKHKVKVEARRIERESRHNEAESRAKAKKIPKWNTAWHNEVKAKKEQAARERATIESIIDSTGREAWDARYKERQRVISTERMHDPEYIKKWKDNSRLCERCKAKPIRCIDTGIAYTSASSAAKILGLDKRAVARAAQGKQRAANGLRFEYSA